MRPDNGLIFVLAFTAFSAALLVGGLWMANWARRKRAEGLEQAAQGMNWRYEAKPGPVATVLPGIEALPLFQRGPEKSRSIEHLLSERNTDRPARLFDYRYTTGSGDDKHRWIQTIAAFDLGDGASLPAFTMAPESFWHRIGERFGYPDIDFEPYPEFSARYRLKGADEDAVRRLFRDALLGFFEHHQGLNVEGQGRWLVVYRPGRRVSPAELPAWRETAAEVARAFEPAAARG